MIPSRLQTELKTEIGRILRNSDVDSQEDEILECLNQRLERLGLDELLELAYGSGAYVKEQLAKGREPFVFRVDKRDEAVGIKGSVMETYGSALYDFVDALSLDYEPKECFEAAFRSKYE